MIRRRYASGCLLVLALAGCSNPLKTPPELDYDGPAVTEARNAKVAEFGARLDAVATRAPGLFQTASGTDDTCEPGDWWKQHTDYSYRCKVRLVRTYSFGGELLPNASVIAEALEPGTCPGGMNNLERLLRKYEPRLPSNQLQPADGACAEHRTPIGVVAQSWWNIRGDDGWTMSIPPLSAALDNEWRHECPSYEKYCRVTPIDGEKAVAAAPRHHRWLVVIWVEGFYHHEPWD